MVNAGGQEPSNRPTRGALRGEQAEAGGTRVQSRLQGSSVNAVDRSYAAAKIQMENIRKCAVCPLLNRVLCVS
jgi:hypothetical protein